VVERVCGAFDAKPLNAKPWFSAPRLESSLRIGAIRKLGHLQAIAAQKGSLRQEMRMGRSHRTDQQRFRALVVGDDPLKPLVELRGGRTLSTTGNTLAEGFRWFFSITILS